MFEKIIIGLTIVVTLIFAGISINSNLYILNTKKSILTDVNNETVDYVITSAYGVNGKWSKRPNENFATYTSYNDKVIIEIVSDESNTAKIKNIILSGNKLNSNEREKFINLIIKQIDPVYIKSIII